MKKNLKFDENYYLISQEVNSNVTVEAAKRVCFSSAREKLY